MFRRCSRYGGESFMWVCCVPRENQQYPVGQFPLFCLLCFIFPSPNGNFLRRFHHPLLVSVETHVFCHFPFLFLFCYQLLFFLCFMSLFLELVYAFSNSSEFLPNALNSRMYSRSLVWTCCTFTRQIVINKMSMYQSFCEDLFDQTA